MAIMRYAQYMNHGIDEAPNKGEYVLYRSRAGPYKSRGSRGGSRNGIVP